MLRITVFLTRKCSVQSASQGLLSDFSEEGRKPPPPCLPSHAHTEYLRSNYIAERNNKHNHIKSTLIMSPSCNLEAIATQGRCKTAGIKPQAFIPENRPEGLGFGRLSVQIASLESPLRITTRCAPLPKAFLRGGGGGNLAWPLEVTG